MMEKLKSRKFWMSLAAAVIPLVLQAVTGELTWQVAGGASVLSLLVGVGVLGAEDMAKAIATIKK